MKMISSITENEMISAFLEAEINTQRHGSQYVDALKHLQHHKVPEGFLSNEDYASLRRKVLSIVRGWPDKLLFKDFPSCTWQKGILETSDLGLLDYIHYSYWDELSNGSHRVVDGAASVAAGVIVFEQPHTSFWTIERLTKEGKVFPPLILLRDQHTGRYAVVEGHTRATSFALAGTVPSRQPVIVGMATDENNWSKEQKG